jgi:uncharacterized membrane protein
VTIINYISYVIGIIGIIIICWGIVTGTLKFVHLEFRRLKNNNICSKREYLRHHVGSYLLLGLEFLIAADIIRTIFEPTLEQLAILGAIVAIRTVINYFLNLELKDAHECSAESPPLKT